MRTGAVRRRLDFAKLRDAKDPRARFTDAATLELGAGLAVEGGQGRTLR